MKTKTTITEITQEDLVNLLTTATYGSSWISCTVTKLTREEVKADGDSREDVWAKALLAGFPIYLTDHQAEGCSYGGHDHGITDEDGSVTYRVILDDIKEGLAAAFDGDFEPADEDECELGAKCAMHLRDETSDFDTFEAETLAQIIMFGTIIY